LRRPKNPCSSLNVLGRGKSSTAETYVGSGVTVAQEINGRGPKHTLLRVDDQAVLTKAEKNLPEMETMLNVVFAGHLQIILVGEPELQLVLHPVDLPLESVVGVPQAEGHAGVLKQPRRSGDRRLTDVLRMNWNLMVPFAEVYLGKNRTTDSDVAEIKHVFGSG
jgi:hypothetical protein